MNPIHLLSLVEYGGPGYMMLGGRGLGGEGSGGWGYCFGRRNLVLCQLLAAGTMLRLAGFGRRHLPPRRVVATGGAKHAGLLGSDYCPTTGLEDRNMIAVCCGDTADMHLFQPSQDDTRNLRPEAACMLMVPEGIRKVKYLVNVVGGAFCTQHCMSSGVSPRNFSTAFNILTELDPISDKVASILEDFTLEIGDSESFVQKLEDRAFEVNKMLEIPSLKEEYEREVRPLLASRLLLINRPLGGGWLAYVNALTHSVLKCSPLYLTSLDVMIEKRRLGEKEWESFLGHILEKRIAVADDDWLCTFGTTEKYHFHHGVKGPCEDGSFFRGGSDAGYNEFTHRATISADLMNDAKLSWCAFYGDIPCPNIFVAEAYGMYVLLTHCAKLKLKRGSVWTDNKLLYEVLTGSYSIRPDDPNRGLLQLLRALRAEFGILVPCWVPRELLFVSDRVGRVVTDFIASLRTVQDMNDEAAKIAAKESVRKSLADFSDHFLGSAVFRSSNTKDFNRILDKSQDVLAEFSKPILKDFLSRAECTFYLNVGNEEGAKFKAIKELLENLRPPVFSVIISSLEMKNESAKNFIDDLYGRFATDHQTMDCCTVHNFYCIENSPPGKRRKLVVVSGSDVPEDCYTDADACSIIISLSHEVQPKQRGINEVNIETFACFHGAKFDPKKLNIKKSRKR